MLIGTVWRKIALQACFLVAVPSDLSCSRSVVYITLGTREMSKKVHNDSKYTFTAYSIDAYVIL